MSAQIVTDRRMPPSDAAILLGQVRQLYGPFGVIWTNLITAPITAALLWRVYPEWVLLNWIGLVFVVIAARAVLWQRFTRNEANIENPQAWADRFAFGTLATGALWGLLASVVFVTGDPIYYVFVVFVIGGMCAAASVRDSAYMPAFYGYLVPAIVPLIAILLVKDGIALAEMGLLLTAFAGVLTLMGHENNRRIKEGIRLRIEQTDLNDGLRQAALALEESNVRLRGIGENAQDAIIITDSSDEAIYWNPSAERIFGYSATEIAGKCVHELLVPENLRAKAIGGYKLFMTTGQGPVVGKTLPLQALRKDGSEVSIELSVSAMRQAGTWHALGIARDVTRRKEAEAALQQREAELKEAQQLAHLAGWMWLREGDTVKWSEELYRMLRRNSALPPPAIAEHAQYVTPESHARLLAAFTECQRSGTPFEVDMEAGRVEGTPAWIAFRGKAERDASGKIVRIYATVQDISARKIAEQHITRLHSELAAKVDALRRHEEDTMIIARLNDILQACHTRPEAYPMITAAANKLFRGFSGALAVTAEESSELETVAEWGEEQNLLPAFSIDACWALRTGQKYQSNGADENEACRHFKTAPRGDYVCMPLSVGGRTTGLLHLSAAAGARLEDETIRLMGTFGDVVKLSLSNLRLRESLSEQALRDPLTTMFNRRYLAETLPREIHRARRDKTTLSVAMVDIDHFKDFNDTYGHDAGDVVLKELGPYFRTTLRAGDIACRYGGEEFLLVLPECNLSDAQKRLQRICEEIRRKTFFHRKSPLPSVTVSIGIAELSDDLPSVDVLIAAADEALYAAKRGGRDRVEVIQPVNSERPRPISAA